MIAVGIDLGVSGAMAALDPARGMRLWDLPIVADPDTGKRLDARAFLELLRYAIPANETGVVMAENVHVMRVAGRAMSHSTESTLVGLRYAVHALVDVARVPMRLVQPQAWKKHYGIKADKTGQQARDMVVRLYPHAAGQVKRVKDHNRAEAVLIAHYLRGVAA